ncbi:hypothetical protein V8F20_000883 [Naviculisporaceae sp. PSN 640]
MVSTLTSRNHTPIAQLNPDLPGQSERVVSGEVTITWPYNSVTKTTAFLVAEPDIRLRRTKGQVRVELHGPSANAFSSSGIGAGDEVTFSLDGAEWAKDESPGRVPGARLDWQLLFNQKLSLQAKLSESGEPKNIDIDHPETEPEVTSPVVEEPMVVEPDLPIPQETPLVRKISEYITEYPSPAFMKRARISYGSLFEGGLDIFEEDGGILGKGRKRSRFGRDSSAWRYSSQSPSPDPEPVAQSTLNDDSMTDTQHEPSPKPSPKPQMADEGCQTTDDFMTSHVVQTEPADQQVPAEVPPSPHPKTSEQTVNPVDNSIVDEVQQTSNTMVDEIQQTSPEPAGSVEAAASSLFAISKPVNPAFSMFGNVSTTPMSRNVDLADQVRFGFSHIPQTTEIPAMKDGSAMPEQHDSPVRQAEAPPAVKFADMESYVDAAEEEMETAEDHPVSPQPPNIEEFDRGRWEVHAQSPSYNNVEGGHFEANALIDGTRVGAVEEPQLHSDTMQPDMVPEGFQSYGTQALSPHIVEVDNADVVTVNSSENKVQSEGENLLHAETQGPMDDEDGVGEDDAEYDEDDYVIEEGDYDQRTYNVPDDDDEGLSEEQDEVMQETADRYGEGDVYTEDEERDYDGDEYPEGEYEEGDYGSEGYEESEGEYEADENYYQQSSSAAVAATSGEPVVISLLSDSEDEDEPPAPPPKQATIEDPAMARFQAAEMVAAAGPDDEIGHASEDDDLVSEDDHDLEDEYDPDDDPDLEDEHGLENEQGLEDSHDIEDNHDLKDDHGPEDEYDVNPRENQTQPDQDSVHLDIINHKTHQPQVAAEETMEAGGESDEESEVEWDEEAAEEGELEGEERDVEVEEVEVEVEQEVEVEVEEEVELEEEAEVEGEEARGESEEEPIVLSDDSDHESGEELEESELGRPESPELGEEVLAVEDDEQDDKENAFPEAHKDTSEVALEIIEESEQVDATNDDVEIIEVGDDDEVRQEAEAGQAVAISEPDTARTPMDLEEVTNDAEQEELMEVEQGSEAAHNDSEMREASPEPDSDDETAMDVEATVHEDAEMEDTPEVGDATGGTHLASDAGASRDDYMDMTDTEMTQHEQPTYASAPRDDQVLVVEIPSKVDTEMIQHEQHTYASAPDNDQVLVVEIPSKEHETAIQQPATEQPAPKDDQVLVVEIPSKMSETVIHHPATEHPAPGVLSPPITQSAAFESFSGTTVAESSFISNKNDRPLPPLTPTQSFIATETVSQISVVEEHTSSSSKVVVTEATRVSASISEPVLDSSPFIGQPSDDSELLTKDSEVDEVEEIPEQSQETGLEGAVDEQDLPAAAAQSPSPELVEIEDEEHVADGKTAASETSSFTSPLTRSRARSAQTPKTDKTRSVQEEIAVSSPHSETEERLRAQLQEEMDAARRESSPDLTISLARQSVAAKKSKKGTSEPVRISPRVTRARSNSLQMSVTSEVEEDPTISFARAAVESPSKQRPEAPVEASVPSTATLKSELTKGLRKLPECVSVKNLKNHVDKQANVVGIVVSQPTEPTRAKGGPREYMMSFNITDPSYAPLHIVEVLLYRPHRESLPIVKPGDAVLLQNFEIKAFSNKGFGLRSSADSAWAVYEEILSPEDGAVLDADWEEPPPQIKGPPVEDYEQYSAYMTKLKAWYRSQDETAHEKLDKAVKKFEEIGPGASQSQSQK